MDKKYWDSVAADYDAEIFSSLANDRDDVIISAITQFGRKNAIAALFADSDLDVVSIEKVKYPWNTEFENPPEWMKKPYPWDWLAILKKV